MTRPAFPDRPAAGRALAEVLSAYARRPDVRVLAVPPGGVLVAHEVAAALHAPLDVFLVRRLAVPGHEDYAMGALASGGVRLRNDTAVRLLGVAEADVEAAVQAALRELERCERRLRQDRPPIDVHRRSVLLVDDGLTDVATLLAAVKALRALAAGRIVVALPVGDPAARADLLHEADDVICARPPGAFTPGYEDAAPVVEEQARELLARAALHA